MAGKVKAIQIAPPAGTMIIATLGSTTPTAITTDPGATVDYVVKQIILANSGAAANVVKVYADADGTVAVKQPNWEVSVPTDSTYVIYTSLRLTSGIELYASATVTDEVSATVIAEVEGV